MPTYAYACTQCGHHFEVRQSFTDDTLTECPECAGRLRKLFDAVGVVFKGSGFYRTDSRAAARASDRASGSSGSSASGSGSSGSDTSSSSSSGSSSSGTSDSGSSGSGSSGASGAGTTKSSRSATPAAS